ncbi:hypothetical protein [Rhodococcus sp. (in: high G+C Gram-positive bacteria)]|uniref:hypothetical protein n=1 Tax=Rhodococcus sp. TaxID=1831 RepID=UPI003B8A77CF
MSEQRRAEFSVGSGADTRHRCVEWQPHDTAWVAWMALLTVLLLAVSVPAASLDSNRSPMIGSVLITWVVVGAMFVPTAVVSYPLCSLRI